MCVCVGGGLTEIEGGGVGKRQVLAVKSSTLSVADIITNFRGFPFYRTAEKYCMNINDIQTHTHSDKCLIHYYFRE